MKRLKLIENDYLLEPFEDIINKRAERAYQKELEFTGGKSKLSDVINAHLYYGLHRYADKWVLREWAPNATSIHLIGDFSYWKQRAEFNFKKLDNGNWELELPLHFLRHQELYKLYFTWEGGEGERIPAYCRRVVQDDYTKIYTAQVWDPEIKYQWKHKSPPKVKYPLIYEVHIGMSTEASRVSTYTEFCEKVLPRVAKLGYNTIQIMAISEHPYYGSFGYQVSSFFAPSSRFGSPDELKHLIDEAHGLGIAVVIDIVHSHAVKNESEGLSKYDGTDYQFFHEGEKGTHWLWDSRCFDYSKNDVLNFLLSNCKYWLTEFQFDGFRFDGVTSMMYNHHGLGIDFLNYGMYYNNDQDEDAIMYLTLANKLIHETSPHAISIAEDVSGMPGLAATQEDGGVGFDFRMSMGVADFWIKTIKEKADEHWSVGEMYHQLTNKRHDEHTISYAECHDQAMMGDKTLIFRLIDSKMYTDMSTLNRDAIVDRGLALHKMIRLASISMAGDGYLTFIGNEFGHPEWIDLPREGNNWGYNYARRQWNLVDDPLLRYRFLNEFDMNMIKVAKKEKIFSNQPFAIQVNDPDQVLIFKRGDILFVFNFSPTQSYADYGIQIDAGKYKIILDSDAKIYDGFERNDAKIDRFTVFENGVDMLKLYIPTRTAMVLKRMDK